MLLPLPFGDCWSILESLSLVPCFNRLGLSTLKAGLGHGGPYVPRASAAPGREGALGLSLAGKGLEGHVGWLWNPHPWEWDWASGLQCLLALTQTPRQACRSAALHPGRAHTPPCILRCTWAVRSAPIQCCDRVPTGTELEDLGVTAWIF